MSEETDKKPITNWGTFCRILESEEYGQVLIEASFDEDDDCPCLLVKTKTMTGISEASFGFEDTPNGYKYRDEMLENVTIDELEKLVQGMHDFVYESTAIH